MTRYRFYVGDRTKHGLSVTQRQRDEIADYLVSIFDGYTSYATAGAWRDETGRVIHEPSNVYECLLDRPAPDDAGDSVARTLRDMAEQSSVLYTVESVRGAFV